MVQPGSFIVLVVIVLLGCSQHALAQWTAPNASSNINNTNAGSVGVGTTVPDRKLSVNNTATQSEEIISVYRPAAANTSAGRSRVAFEFRGDGYSDNPNIYGWSLNLPNSVLAKIGATPKSYIELGSVNAGIHASLGFFVQSAGHGGLLERMTISGNGNIGVGTLTPAYRLDVNGEINATGLRINGTPISTGGSSQWSTSGGTSIYYNAGNVGLGTSTPGSKLDVAGTIRGGNADTNIGNHPTYGTGYTAFWRQGADYSLITDGTNSYLNAPVATGNLFFRSANADRMVLQGGTGNVGIGTAAPTAKLHVVGDGRITGNLIVDGTLNAKYQDVAEWVPAARAMAAATVVVLNPNQSNQVMASVNAYDTRVAGVISETPGLMLGESGQGKVLVATTGRVTVKVDAINGPIQIGDLLVTSDKAGVAMKSVPIDIGGVQIHRPGTLIGKALEPMKNGTGEILVLLSLQ